MIRLSFVIPVWNQYALLLACLESIIRQVGFSEQAQADPLGHAKGEGAGTTQAFEIILVDNGSREEEKALLKQNTDKLRRVRLMELPQNTGFSHAVNLGIEAAQGEIVVLLNSDVVLDVHFTQAVMRAMDAHVDWLHAATRMRQFHHRERLDDAGNLLLTSGRAVKLGYGEVDSDQYPSGSFVFSACGGAAVYRKAFFAQVGTFDEDFFAYLEDVDLGFRAQRQSLLCGWIPEAVSYHIGSASTGSMKNTFTVRLQARNQLGMLVKNLPASLWLLLGIPILGTMLAQGVKYAMNRNGNGRAYLKGFFEALRMLPTYMNKRKAAMPGWKQPTCELLRQMRGADILYRKSRRHRMR